MALEGHRPAAPGAIRPEAPTAPATTERQPIIRVWLRRDDLVIYERADGQLWVGQLRAPMLTWTIGPGEVIQ